MYKVIICFLCGLALYACNKDKPVDANPTPIPIDTVPTMVDNTPFFEVLLNDEPWKPAFWAHDFSALDSSFAGYIGRMTIREKKSGWPSGLFNLKISSFKLITGPQVIKNRIGPGKMLDGTLVFYDYDAPREWYSVDTLKDNFIELTRIDTAQKIIEGVLNCSMIRDTNDIPDLDLKDRYEFKNGKFRIKYKVL